MKGLFGFLSRFVSPYKRNLILSVVFNLLSAVLNVFSFALIVPILELLFKINKADYVLIENAGSGFLGLPEFSVLKNNFYYYINETISQFGASTTLLILGLVLVFITFFKTGCYFASTAVMVPTISSA